MVIKNSRAYWKLYWIIYHRVKAKYPHSSEKYWHITAHKAIAKLKHKKTAPKGLTANLIVIDEFPLK